MSTLVTIRAWATARDLSVRQAQVYRSAGRLAGAVETPKGWLVPADVEPTPATSRDVVPVTQPATSHDDAPTSRVLPQGLWSLEDVAAFYGTTVGRIRFMGEHPRSPFVVGRFGPPDAHGHATWRVWVL